jgi:hypothetical protein
MVCLFFFFFFFLAHSYSKIINGDVVFCFYLNGDKGKRRAV